MIPDEAVMELATPRLETTLTDDGKEYLRNLEAHHGLRLTRDPLHPGKFYQDTPLHQNPEAYFDELSRESIRRRNRGTPEDKPPRDVTYESIGDELDLPGDGRTGSGGLSPQLTNAVCSSNSCKLRKLVDSGTSLDGSDQDGNGALHLAAAKALAENFRWIATRRPHLLERQNNHGLLPTEIFVLAGQSVCLSALLRDSVFGSLLLESYRRVRACSLQHCAVRHNQVECLRALLACSPADDSRDTEGLTPLHAASALGNLACLELLIHNGANVFSTTPSGEQARTLAARNGNDPCVMLLGAATVCRQLAEKLALTERECRSLRQNDSRCLNGKWRPKGCLQALWPRTSASRRNGVVSERAQSIIRDRFGRLEHESDYVSMNGLSGVNNSRRKLRNQHVDRNHNRLSDVKHRPRESPDSASIAEQMSIDSVEAAVRSSSRRLPRSRISISTTTQSDRSSGIACGGDRRSTATETTERSDANVDGDKLRDSLPTNVRTSSEWGLDAWSSNAEYSQPAKRRSPPSSRANLRASVRTGVLLADNTPRNSTGQRFETFPESVDLNSMTRDSLRQNGHDVMTRVSASQNGHDVMTRESASQNGHDVTTRESASQNGHDVTTRESASQNGHDVKAVCSEFSKTSSIIDFPDAMRTGTPRYRDASDFKKFELFEFDVPSNGTSAPRRDFARRDFRCPATSSLPTSSSSLALPIASSPSVTPSSVTPSSVTPSSATPVSVTPSSVTPSSVKPSSVKPSFVTPSSATPVSVTPSFVTPSFVTPSSATPYSVTPSSATPVSVTPFSATPVSITPSFVTPPSATPVSVTPFSATPVSVTPSFVTPPSATPYSSTPSSVTPFSVTPFSVTPSSVTPSSVTPSSVTPSSVMPMSITQSSVTPSSVTPSSGSPSVRVLLTNGRARVHEGVKRVDYADPPTLPVKLNFSSSDFRETYLRPLRSRDAYGAVRYPEELEEKTSRFNVPDGEVLDGPENADEFDEDEEDEFGSFAHDGFAERPLGLSIGASSDLHERRTSSNTSISSDVSDLSSARSKISSNSSSVAAHNFLPLNLPPNGACIDGISSEGPTAPEAKNGKSFFRPPDLKCAISPTENNCNSTSSSVTLHTASSVSSTPVAPFSEASFKYTSSVFLRPAVAPWSPDDDVQHLSQKADGKMTDKVASNRRTSEEWPTNRRMSDERPTDRRMSDEKPTDRRMSDGKPTDRRMSDGKQTDRRMSDEKPTDRRMSNEKPTDRRMSDERPTDRRMSDEKPTDRRISDERPTDRRTTDERSTDMRTTDERSTDMRTTDERSTDMITRDERSTDMITRDERSTDMITRDERSTDMITRDERSTDMITRDERSTDMRTTDERSTDRRTSDERSTDRRTTDVWSTDRRTTDVWSTDRRMADERSTARKMADERSTDRRMADERSTDRRMSDDRSTDGTDEWAATGEMTETLSERHLSAATYKLLPYASLFASSYADRLPENIAEPQGGFERSDKSGLSRRARHGSVCTSTSSSAATTPSQAEDGLREVANFEREGFAEECGTWSGSESCSEGDDADNSVGVRWTSPAGQILSEMSSDATPSWYSPAVLVGTGQLSDDQLYDIGYDDDIIISYPTGFCLRDKFASTLPTIQEASEEDTQDSTNAQHIRKWFDDPKNCAHDDMKVLSTRLVTAEKTHYPRPSHGLREHFTMF